MATTEIDFTALDFFATEMVARPSGRTESEEIKAIRSRMAQGIELSNASVDAQTGYGTALEFKMPKSGKLTEARTTQRKNSDGTTREVQIEGGKDVVLNQALRVLRDEAEKIGRGLSVQVTETDKGKAWLVKFRTKSPRKTASK